MKDLFHSVKCCIDASNGDMEIGKLAKGCKYLNLILNLMYS